MFGKSQKVINLVIEDYVLRILETPKNALGAITILSEKPLPEGMISGGKVVDEIGFFEFMKDVVKEHSIKKRQVRFYVPNALAFMREVEFPADLKEKEMKDYIQFEIGQSIHLPFNDPVFDLEYHLEDEPAGEVRKAILYAAPREELAKYTELLADVSLKPIAADVTALGLYRYFHHMYNTSEDKVYLLLQLNATSFNIGIFSNRRLEFMRYQDLDVKLVGWNYDEELDAVNWEFKQNRDEWLEILDDQVIELERIMNFYQISMNQGEKQVDELIILGDNPYVTEFYNRMKTQIDIPARLLKAYISTMKESEIGVQYIPLLGLALKGAVKHAT